MAEVQIVDLRDQLRPQQREIAARMRRFSVLVCHRRFGKTVLMLLVLLSKALDNRKTAPRYAYIAPYRVQAKEVAWDYLKRFAGAIPGAEFNEGELRCDLPNGARIQLYGADNPDRMRGLYLDGAVFDEYAQINPSTWTEIVRPMLADRKGWAAFIGTVAGRDAFFRLFEHAKGQMADGNPDWFAALYRASKTGIVDEAELIDAQALMTEDEYAREFECDFDAAVPGTFYAQALREAEDAGRIGVVPWEPDRPVHTAWDIGFSDDTAIWFYQQVGRALHVIDFYASNGEGIGHYVNELQRKPYTYGKHFGPHDLRPKTMASGGRSLWEQANSLGFRFHIVPELSVNDGINAVRRIMPRVWFDAEKCAAGLDALRLYRREWDDDKKAFKDKPLHDWTSHAADAMRYLAVGYTEQRPDEFPGQPRAVPTWNEAAAMIDRGSRQREWA